MTKYIDRYYLNGELYGIKFAEPGWQPGANTLLYYPFDGDVLDHSGNSRDATSYGTVSYGTNYIDLTSGYLSVPNIEFSNTNTFSFWGKRTTTSNGAFFDSQTSSKQILRVFYNNSGDKLYCYSDIPSFTGEKTMMSPTDTDWHLFTVTTDSTGATYYFNGQQVATSSGRPTATYQSTYIKIGTRTNVSSPENPGIYVSNFIIEDKARTAQEISDYYNQTKSLYGIN